MSIILREIYDRLPDVVQVPEHLRQQRGEVIILPLDDEPAPRTASDSARRQALLSAWNCITPARSIESIDRGVSAMRDEWADRTSPVEPDAGSCAG